MRNIVSGERHGKALSAMRSLFKDLRFKRFRLVTAFWPLLVVQATGPLAQPAGVEITAFGEFGPAKGDMVAAPDTAKGTVKRVVTNKLLHRVNCITARLGTR